MLSIQTIHLTKSFESLTAVKDLSLEVKTGEIFGLVGPDAAGKTTTLRMLCGILAPDGGEATVVGCDIRREAESLKEKVGYLPQRFGLYGDLTVLENIHFYGNSIRFRSRKEGAHRKAPSICQSETLRETQGSGSIRWDEAETGTDLVLDSIRPSPLPGRANHGSRSTLPEGFLDHPLRSFERGGNDPFLDILFRTKPSVAVVSG